VGLFYLSVNFLPGARIADLSYYTVSRLFSGCHLASDINDTGRERAV
jgi:hypothetical protein